MKNKKNKKGISLIVLVITIIVIIILAAAVIPKPFFMAGGLRVENVSQIIFQTSPYGVDVSGGVEIDGYKDFTKMTEFIYTVKAIKE